MISYFAMKISGSGPKPPAQGAGDTPGVDDVKGKSGTGSGTGFADKIDKSAATDPTHSSRAASAATSVQPLHAVGAIADISADLRAGKIDAQAALDKVVDRVVAHQVGPDAPAAVREQVGAALRQALEDDPLLAEKIRALGSS